MNVIFGAGMIGEITLRACQARGIPVVAFCDERRVGILYGLAVVTSEDMKRIYPDATVYLTSPNVQGQIDRLKELGYKNWRSCGEVLKGFDWTMDMFNPCEYSLEHTKYLVKTCLHLHENNAHPERLTVQSVDLMVTEKCSMKCRDCSNLMQYYESPENADLNQMFRTIDDFLAQMDEVYEFRLIGGEPFVNKELHLFAEKLCAEPKVQKVSVFTNGTIMPREHQWAAFKHPKMRLFITDYDELSRNLKNLVSELESRGINYVSEKANEWTDCSTLVKHNRTVAQNQALWNDCCAKNLATLHNGNLYRCPFAANAASLKAVPDYKDDYLTMPASRETITTFLREKTYIETCDHCTGRSFGAPEIVPAIQTRKPLVYKKYAHGS